MDDLDKSLKIHTGFRAEIHYLDEAFRFVGPQLLSPKAVRMTCKYRHDGGPARFIVNDEIIPATADYIVSDEQHGLTCVGNDRVRIEQVEHILSALYGMAVLDTDVHLEYDDGSPVDKTISPPVAQLNSREFSHAILSSFLSNRLPEPSAEPKQAVQLTKCYIFQEDSNQVTNGDPGFAVFAPLHKLHITVHINFPKFPKFLRTQIYTETISPLDYAKSICWARSFFRTPHPHTQTWDTLRERYSSVLREQENQFRSIMIDYTEEGWITPVVVNTEPVRHKMLDFVGDLALLGAPLCAGIYVYKPSHRFNRRCVMTLAAELTRRG